MLLQQGNIKQIRSSSYVITGDHIRTGQRFRERSFEIFRLKRLLQHRAISILWTHPRRSIPGRKDERHVVLAERVGYRVSVPAIQVQVEDRYIHYFLADKLQRARNVGGRPDQLATKFVEHVLDQHRDHHLVFNDEDLAIRFFPLAQILLLRVSGHYERMSGTLPVIVPKGAKILQTTPVSR